MNKYLNVILTAIVCTALGGCVSTVVGVAGTAVKGTVKVGTGVAKAGGKAAGAVIGSGDEEETESEDR